MYAAFYCCSISVPLFRQSRVIDIVFCVQPATRDSPSSPSSPNPAATLASPSTDGTVYRPKQENQFIHSVLEELDAFTQRDKHNSVLLFPVLPSRLRFLIHKTTERHPHLSTFSVGEGWDRRVAVCYSHLRREVEEDSDSDSGNLYEELPRRGGGRGGRGGRGGVDKSRRNSRLRTTRTRTPTLTPTSTPTLTPASTSPRRQRAQQRPDKAIYDPRGARARRSLQGSPGAAALQKGAEPPVSGSSGCGCVVSGSASCSRCFGSDAAEATPLPSTTNHTTTSSNQEDPPPSTGDTTANDSEPDGWSTNSSTATRCLFCEQQDMVTCLSGPETCTAYYFKAITLNQSEEEWQEEEEEEGQAEEDLIETRVCVSQTPEPSSEDDCDFSQEIIDHLTETAVAIERAQNDYSNFENVRINPEEFGHVIEIYDFPAMFKTEDLVDAFTEYSDGGMKIQWVDDTHALGVFSSKSAALHALSIRHHLLKTRTLMKGSKRAKGKAVRRAEYLQPVKERPRTDSAVARRMVTHALGLKRGGAAAHRY